MSFFNKISGEHLDILKEVGNIGAGHAATALSTMLNKKIDMNVPCVSMVSFNEMIELAGGPEQVVASVFLRIEGDAPGSMFFILSLGQAEYFVREMTNDPEFNLANGSPSEIGLSALQELGNILSGSYLSSLSDFTNLNLYPSVPALSIEMAGAVISLGLLELSRVGDYAIVIDTALSENGLDKSVNGHFFLLPDPPAFKTIFASLGVPVND